MERELRPRYDLVSSGWRTDQGKDPFDQTTLSEYITGIWSLLAAVGSPDEHFKRLHERMTWSQPTDWSPSAMDRMCKALFGKPREDLRLNQSDAVFQYGTDSERRGHYHLARRCCEEARIGDRLPCFADLRRSFITRYCHLRGDQHPCCRKEGEQKYACFVRPYAEGNNYEAMLDNHVSARRASMDDPEHGDDHIRESHGKLREAKDDEIDKNAAEDSELLLGAIEELDSEEGEYCMENYFPEHGLDEMTTESIRKGICPASGFPTSGCEAKGCCRAGAHEGKRLDKKHCPYFQCRAFYKIFYKRHRACIKHKLFCGFFFVACCERQYYKDFYQSRSTKFTGD